MAWSVTSLVAWLSRRPLPPLLLRVRVDDVVVAGEVDVTAARPADGTIFRSRAVAAQGVILVPWPGGRRVDFTLRQRGLAGRLSLRPSEIASGHVHEVRLEAETASLQVPSAHGVGAAEPRPAGPAHVAHGRPWEAVRERSDLVAG